MREMQNIQNWRHRKFTDYWVISSEIERFSSKLRISMLERFQIPKIASINRIKYKIFSSPNFQNSRQWKFIDYLVILSWAQSFPSKLGISMLERFQTPTIVSINRIKCKIFSSSNFQNSRQSKFTDYLVIVSWTQSFSSKLGISMLEWFQITTIVSINRIKYKIYSDSQPTIKPLESKRCNSQNGVEVYRNPKQTRWK